ncbi:MAG: hypothetical protein J6S28_07710, partial [Clostridia bacterium]|nr:hypothetical protein [Clostridia bacterium]
MKKTNVRQMLVKLLAGLMLAFVLIGATVPAVFAEEEVTTEAQSAEQTTEAQTAAPEQEAGNTSLSEGLTKDLAELLSGNDLARQLFMAAAGFNAEGQLLKYTANDGKYLNDKGEFSFDTTLSIEKGFTEVENWDDIKAYALQILTDAEKLSKKD